jgi:hypothetical protein
MYKEAFEIAKLQQENPRRWSVGGRAYVDINLNDRLTSSQEGGTELRVIGIVTYDRSTDLLSTMMTGTLLVEGEIEGEPHYLYVKND